MLDVTVLIPIGHEPAGSAHWLPRTAEALRRLNLTYEILLVGAGNPAPTGAGPDEAVCVVSPEGPGYGSALRAGLAAARGAYLLTLNVGLAHDPDLIAALWQARTQGDVIVGSRYAPGGSAVMPLGRRVLSRTLNGLFRRGLSLPVHDLSSANRLYPAHLVKRFALESADFDILSEILVKCYAAGMTIAEIPIRYCPSDGGHRYAAPVRLAWAYLRTFGRMWRLRNSIECADYDYRAHDSVIPLQRYWQRRRHALILALAAGAGTTLDLGCGSSHILADLPAVVGLDLLLRKLRFAWRFGKPLVNGSIWALPFPDRSFDCVVCSQVIEHVPGGETPFLEMRRVLRPGGRLVIGTPDYGRPIWPLIELVYGRVAPGGYAHEHITHYTQASLAALLQRLGFRVEQTAFILGAEMILRCVYEPEPACEPLNREAGAPQPRVAA